MPIVRRLRDKRPEPEFHDLAAADWDGKDEGELGARLAAYHEAGIGHVPRRARRARARDWLRAVERVAHAADGNVNEIGHHPEVFAGLRCDMDLV